jgi:hypothetical protein
MKAMKKPVPYGRDAALTDLWFPWRQLVREFRPLAFYDCAHFARNHADVLDGSSDANDVSTPMRRQPNSQHNRGHTFSCHGVRGSVGGPTVNFSPRPQSPPSW